MTATPLSAHVTTIPDGLVAIPRDWQSFVPDMIAAAQRDCEASSASCEAFGPALGVASAALVAEQMHQRPAAPQGWMYASEDFLNAVCDLASCIETDAQVSDATRATFGVFLATFHESKARLDEHQSLVDAVDRAADFLASGKALDSALERDYISESSVRTVLQMGVDTFRRDWAPTPEAVAVAARRARVNP